MAAAVVFNCNTCVAFGEGASADVEASSFGVSPQQPPSSRSKDEVASDVEATSTCPGSSSSDADSDEDSCAPCSPAAAVSCPVTTMPTATRTPLRSSLRSSARLFTSFGALQPGMVVPGDHDMTNALEVCKTEILGCSHVTGVDFEPCFGRGGSVVMNVRVGHYVQEVVQWAVAVAKAAMVNASAASEGTYLIGYALDPFEDLPDGGSFQSVLASVDSSEQSNICWDTFQNGFCARRKTCRWCHPRPDTTVQLTVKVLPPAPPVVISPPPAPPAAVRSSPALPPWEAKKCETTPKELPPWEKKRRSEFAAKLQTAPSREEPKERVKAPTKAWADMFDEDDDDTDLPIFFKSASTP